jgi:hypothetical protein
MPATQPSIKPQLTKSVSLKISAGLTLLDLLIVSIAYGQLQPEIPLFYSLSSPQQHLTGKEWIFLLPALSLGFNLVNLGLMRLLHSLDQFVLKLFNWATAGLQILLLMIIIRLLLII